MYREKLNPAKESAITAAVETKVKAVSGSGAVFTEPVYFSSVSDFVETIKELDESFEEREDFEIRSVIIELTNFTDLDAGQCPNFTLDYAIHVFYQFAERSNGSGSYGDFVAFIVNLRNKFLKSFNFPGLDHVSHTGLTVVSRITTDVESRFFPGILGTYMDLNLKVEVTG